jgi:CheY-like chemotaxis protein
MANRDYFFLKHIVNLLSVCLYWKDEKFRYVGCNLAQLKALGYSSKADIYGKTDKQLYPPSIATKLHQVDMRLAQSMTPIEMEEVRITATGEYVTFISRKVPLFDDKKVFKGIASISVNITELNEAVKSSKPKTIKINVTEKIPKDRSSIRAKILLVEDALLAQEMTAGLLLTLQCSVDIVNNIKDALQQFKQNTYDLVITDISLEDGTGITLAKTIRAYEKKQAKEKTPLIGLTAHASDTIKRQCQKAQFDALLTKPLLTDKAEDLLITYVSTGKKDMIATKTLSQLPTKDDIISYSALNKITHDGSINPFDTIFPMMIEALHTEKPKLKSAYTNRNWASLHFLVHKLRGSAAYCAAKRLEKHCEKLETYLEENQTIQKTKINTLYKHLVSEINALEKKLLTMQAKNK